ncbi:hypothetical protein Tco_0013537 [Tanacetum coccineum]
MGDENPIRTLGEYSKPSHEGYRNTIELPDIALYDNESWNDPMDFAKPVKAITLPKDVPSTSDRHLIELKNQVQHLMEAHLASTQPTQVNEITTSFEIYSGPHDTQYCMENPEQAFVEYASSRTDEAGERSDTPLLEGKDITDVGNLGSNKDDEGIEWLDVEEPLDLVDTSKESVYESLIKEMPKCSLNYDFRIKKGDPRNLKIPCMIVTTITRPLRLPDFQHFRRHTSHSKLIDKKVKSFLSQCLGKDICQLIFCSDEVHFNHPIFHLVFDEVVSDVNMLGLGILDVVATSSMALLLSQYRGNCIQALYWYKAVISVSLMTNSLIYHPIAAYFQMYFFWYLGNSAVISV